MNKLILSVILLISSCAVFTACTKTDNTKPPAGPMTASFTLAGQTASVPFIGSHVDATIQPNAADANGHYKDSTVSIKGHVYIPGTVRDSVLEIDLTIFKYKAGMGGITIDNDSFAYAQLTDMLGGTHIAANGQIIFTASTPFGATGTFNFKCTDNIVINNGWFVANWRQ